MKRKDFIKKTMLAGLGSLAVPDFVKAKNVKLKKSNYNEMLKHVGFNHLPIKTEKTMNTVLHKANTRGHANHGWLNSNHSFSFANYYNPDRMNFGVLRVLNDDTVAPGRGFDTHPHDNMEIISIPLEGDLEHKDSMGNLAVIKEGDVQVMSAGTGVFHSEYNKHSDRPVKFLQIWVFPNKKNVAPRYDQISIREMQKTNELYQVLSPNPDDQGVWIQQNAWFHMGHFNKKTSTTYTVKAKENGLYAFVLSGEVEVEGQALTERDGFGIWGVDKVKINAQSNSRVLLMDVPMNL